MDCGRDGCSMFGKVGMARKSGTGDRTRPMGSQSDTAESDTDRTDVAGHSPVAVETQKSKCPCLGLARERHAVRHLETRASFSWISRLFAVHFLPYYL